MNVQEIINNINILNKKKLELKCEIINKYYENIFDETHQYIIFSKYLKCIYFHHEYLKSNKFYNIILILIKNEINIKINYINDGTLYTKIFINSIDVSKNKNNNDIELLEELLDKIMEIIDLFII